MGNLLPPDSYPLILVLFGGFHSTQLFISNQIGRPCNHVAFTFNPPTASPSMDLVDEHTRLLPKHFQDCETALDWITREYGTGGQVNHEIYYCLLDLLRKFDTICQGIGKHTRAFLASGEDSASLMTGVETAYQPSASLQAFASRTNQVKTTMGRKTTMPRETI